MLRIYVQFRKIYKLAKGTMLLQLQQKYKFRSTLLILNYLLCLETKVWRKLALSWGVTPMLSETFNSVDVMFYKAMECAKKALNLQSGDNVVLTAGPINGQSGNTNTIKVEQI